MIESLATTIAADVVKRIALSVPKSIDKWRFARFFGPPAVTGEGFRAVVDPYTHPAPRTGNRYIKRFMDKRPDQPLVGEDNVLGVNVIRLISYTAALFSSFTKNHMSIPIVADYDVAALWDSSFICFGSSDSNLKTYDIETLPEQKYYKLTFGPDGHRGFEVGGKHFGFEGRRDRAIILKMRNPRHPEHLLFVCAGLGEWGTTGATYYLFDRWKDLYKQHGLKPFLKIVEVEVGVDQSAKEIYSEQFE